MNRKLPHCFAPPIRLGAMSANATPAQLQLCPDFGMSLGLAFQVIDDILDVTQTSETLGKSAGKDLIPKRRPILRLSDLKQSRKVAKKLTEEAHKSLKPFGRKAEILHGLADYLLDQRILGRATFCTVNALLSPVPQLRSKKPFVRRVQLWQFHRLSNFPIRH